MTTRAERAEKIVGDSVWTLFVAPFRMGAAFRKEKEGALLRGVFSCAVWMQLVVLTLLFWMLTGEWWQGVIVAMALIALQFSFGYYFTAEGRAAGPPKPVAPAKKPTGWLGWLGLG